MKKLYQVGGNNQLYHCIRFYCCSVAKSCVTLCNPMNCSTPGFPVLHYRLQFAQTHVHGVSDAIQQSCHLLPTPPFALNFSQCQDLFKWVSSLHRWPNYGSFSFSTSPSNEYSGLISFRIDWLDLPCNPRDSQESYPTPQFKSISSLALSLLYGLTLTSIHDYWKNHTFDYMNLC